MRRQTLVWLAAPLVALTLAGCGEKDSGQPPAPAAGTGSEMPATGAPGADSDAPAQGYAPPPTGYTTLPPAGTPGGAPPPEEFTPPDE